MSARMKLVSCIGAFMLVLGLVVVGVLAASSETITMNGSVQFQVNDKSLFVKDVRMQETGSEEIDISDFTPGYINGDFNFTVGDFENNRGSFTLYFDIINTTTTRYDVSVDYSGLSDIAGLEINVSDQIPANLEAITAINADTPITTTLSLTIVNPNLATIDLSKVIITIKEHVLEIYQSFDFELIDGTVNEVRITGHSGGENVVIPKTFSFEETPINSFKIIDQIGTGLGEKQTISAYLGEVIYTYSNGEGGTANFYSLKNIMSVDFSLYPITFKPTYRFEFKEYSEENAGLLLLTLLGPSNEGYTQNINYYLTNDQFTKQAFTTEGFMSYIMETCPEFTGENIEALEPLFATGPIILETDPLTENIIYEGTDYIVKEIGDRAFDYLTNLTSIIIPEGVTSIGSSAFLQCENLISVSIPNSMISIGNDAFANCYNLTSITIPEGLLSIGASAFRGCYALAEVYNYSNVTTNLPSYAKIIYNASQLADNKPDTRIQVVDNVQYYNYGDDFIALAPTSRNVTDVSLDSGTTEINQYAFYNYYSLTSVDFGENSQLTRLGESAFSNCYSLTSITIPSSVETIGDNAFSWCYSLTSITIPSSVTSIGSFAFGGCYALAEVYNYSNVTTNLPSYAKIIYNASQLADNKPDTRIQVVDNVQYYNYGDDFIALAPTSRNVTDVSLDSGTTEINQYAFYNCYSLTSITINAITPPTLGSNAIPSSETNIYVPEESVYAYKVASGWSSYSNKISAIVNN